MAKRTGYIAGGLMMMLFCASLWAQQKTNVKPEAGKQAKDTVHKKKIVINRPKLYLGRSEFSGGKLGAKAFDSLLKQGIHSHDSLGNEFKVLGFNFSYAERRLFEDSVGDLKWQIDFSSEYCPGDTITSNVAESIYRRIKHGDTVFIEHAVVVKPNLNRPNDTLFGRALKCEIIK